MPAPHRRRRRQRAVARRTGPRAERTSQRDRARRRGQADQGRDDPCLQPGVWPTQFHLHLRLEGTLGNGGPACGNLHLRGRRARVRADAGRRACPHRGHAADPLRAAARAWFDAGSSSVEYPGTDRSGKYDARSGTPRSGDRRLSGHPNPIRESHVSESRDWRRVPQEGCARNRPVVRSAIARSSSSPD